MPQPTALAAAAPAASRCAARAAQRIAPAQRCSLLANCWDAGTTTPLGHSLLMKREDGLTLSQPMLSVAMRCCNSAAARVPLPRRL